MQIAYIYVNFHLRNYYTLQVVILLQSYNIKWPLAAHNSIGWDVRLGRTVGDLKDLVAGFILVETLDVS